MIMAVTFLMLIPFLLFARKSNPDDKDEEKRISNVVMSATIVIISLEISMAYYIYQLSKYC